MQEKSRTCDTIFLQHTSIPCEEANWELQESICETQGRTEVQQMESCSHYEVANLAEWDSRDRSNELRVSKFSERNKEKDNVLF